MLDIWHSSAYLTFTSAVYLWVLTFLYCKGWSWGFDRRNSLPKVTQLPTSEASTSHWLQPQGSVHLPSLPGAELSHLHFLCSWKPMSGATVGDPSGLRPSEGPPNCSLLTAEHVMSGSATERTGASLSGRVKRHRRGLSMLHIVWHLENIWIPATQSLVSLCLNALVELTSLIPSQMFHHAI